MSHAPVMVDGQSFVHQDDLIAQSIIQFAENMGRPVEILEAGCGSRWWINLRTTPYVLTGVDLDADAMKMRIEQQLDLHRAIVGDLHTVELPEKSFDVVYSGFVLEHLQDPRRMMANVLRSLRRRALFIFRIPDPASAAGFVTRLTPHWFHVFYHRWAVGNPNAGKPGYGPYQTYYSDLLYKNNLIRYMNEQGFQCQQIVCDSFAQYTKGPVGRLFQTGARVVDKASGGRLTSNHNNLIYIFQRELG